MRHGAIRLALMCATACGNEDTDEADVSWGGEQTHLRAQGVIEGEDIDIDLAGKNATDALVSCKLEYEQQKGKPETARMVEAKFKALIEGESETRFLELELKHHDLTAHEPGSSIDIVPRDDSTTIDADQIVCEWEWHTWDEATQTDGDESLEVSAAEGTVTLEAFTGLPKSGVPKANEATLGVTIDAAWSVDEKVSISVTAPCVEVEVGEI